MSPDPNSVPGPVPRRRHRQGVVAVIRRADRFLVILRSQFVSAPGTYCFPGGGVEPGETEQEAVQRELNEELGIHSSRPLRRIWQNKSQSGIALGWWLTEIATEPVADANPDEVAAMHWWDRETILSNDKLLSTNREFFDSLTRGEIVI